MFLKKDGSNRNKDILKVSPNGTAKFACEVNVGAVKFIDSGITIKDGEISVENNEWKGY